MENRGSLLTVTVVAIIISLSLHQNASAFSTRLAHQASYSRFTTISLPHRRRVTSAGGRFREQNIFVSLHTTNSNDDNGGATPPTPLCDLQTFLRLCNLVQTGGEAKNVIQNSQCVLNGVVETRRSKKLFPGDTVTFGDVTNLDVATEVERKGYVYKPKVKKAKPLPRVDADGNLEFGGRYRSEEWRAERKLKKEDRKKKNQGSKK